MTGDQEPGRLRALDGLRAIAVLAVMANHTRLPLARGGYLGVDVFFVLSGFLITRILLNEDQRAGRISLRRFYMRRALRLFPALISTVALGGVLVAVGLVDGQGYGMHALMALLYLQDLAVTFGWGEGLGPLNHTWSLAIEEHFYLLWPPVLMAVSPYGKRAVAWTAGVGAVVSFAIMQVAFTASTSPTSPVYYRPDARAAALLLGCLLAAMPALRTPRWLGPTVLLLLLGTLALAPEANTRLAFIGTMPAVWLATMALIVDGHQPRSLVARVLALRPMVYVGAISYGLYLYHPLVAEALSETGPRRSFLAPLTIAVAFAVAAVSHRFVERPFMRRKARYSARSQPQHTSG